MYFTVLYMFAKALLSNALLLMDATGIIKIFTKYKTRRFYILIIVNEFY